MMPDLKTLMLLYIITNVINAGTMAVILSQSRGRFAGISFWLITMILQVAGSILHVLRGIAPDLISMTLANAMVLAGVLMMLVGLERFTGKRSRQAANYILLAVFVVVSAYFVVVQPNLLVRDIAVSAMLMIYTFQCCWLLLRRTDPNLRRITRLSGIVFAVYAAFNFGRIILNIVIPEQSNDFYQSGAVNALAITGYIVLNLCLTISLVLMVNRRLVADVKAQEEKFTTAFQSSPYAITLTRPSDGTIFEVNEGFVSITGYRYAEVIGKTTLGLNLWVREEDRLAVTKELARGREIQGVEYQFRKKTGEVLTGLFSASLVTINNETCILANIGDITARKQVEEQIRLHEVHLQDLLSLHRMAKASEKEILDFTLEASLRAAQSKFTFVGLMNADETVLGIHAWSKETMEQCAITDKPIQFPLAQTSLLGESVRQRRPIIVNDYLSSDVPKKGIPSGHVPIARFLSVPVFSAGKIVAVGAVANKETDYSDSDISAFSALLNEMW
ncbi:MAG: GAF domain-containing protein, partial [bacterium]